MDMAEIRNFIFDTETNIDINALENYITTNKEGLLEQEEELNIDTKSMMIKGEPSRPSASNASTSSQSSQPS